MSPPPEYDIAIIGGGVNGCGIARDAAGRGLSVFLCEQGDLAQATSSASTKLFHGGLRYLEYFEFRLVREALVEREVLLKAMPHISWPMRFVLPHHSGLRPAWMLRIGLFLYDHLGGRRILPPARTLDLSKDPAGRPLKAEYRKAFEYSDCWVQDSRLVVLNARDAAERGATIAVGTLCREARREDGVWRLMLEGPETGTESAIRARALVNAGGPWVEQIIRERIGIRTDNGIRLVRGSHIVVRRLFKHDRAYIFQNADERVVFAIPYEEDYTLIGTTDRDHEGPPGEAVCTDEEASYLCAAVSEYFETPVTVDDIVWTYSGVRPLYDDGSDSATEATRDYVLTVDGGSNEAPVLNIFGGKITTYRRLAEAALEELADYFPEMDAPWTAGVALPGGDFGVDQVDRLVRELRQAHPFVDEKQARRLVRAYGTEAAVMLSGARERPDLGRDFGAGLSEAEVRWLMTHEWARSAEDVVWRRSKLGLAMTPAQVDALGEWMKAQHVAATSR
ncbi:MAG: glycerol-3-phosphate dehydrogenase [Pseudomonadota bacterium]|nr:glycerol-3-phosphate dehydrogenase [Pseudomonadota bacterium]